MRRKKGNQNNIAKERLRMMLDARKRRLDERTMTQIRQEIGCIINKYVDIEPENIEIKIILKE